MLPFQRNCGILLLPLAVGAAACAIPAARTVAGDPVQAFRVMRAPPSIQNGSEQYDLRMSSERVVVAGHLTGMGRSEDCKVGAIKVSLAGTNLYEYTRVLVFDTATDLPDGEYELIFSGTRVKVKRINGAWISPV
jgi:hypothetical protein